MPTHDYVKSSEDKNNPVNLSMVSSIGIRKHKTKFEIYFDGAGEVWKYDVKADRDADYDAIMTRIGVTP